MMHQPIQKKQGEGRPLRRKQLDVFDVGEAKRMEGEGHPRDEGRRAMAREVVDQGVHPHAGEGVGGQRGEIDRQQRVIREPDDGQREERLAQQRLGVGQGVAVRVKAVGVIERQRIARQDVRIPRQNPGVEERIGGGEGGAAQVQGQRVREHDGGERKEQQQGARPSISAP